MAETARPPSTPEPKLFGSRRLYRWMHKPQKTESIIYEDDTRGLELIKLITIARLHSEVAVESTRPASYAPAQENTGEISR